MDLNNPEIDYYISHKVAWNSLPYKIKEIFGNAQKGYEKAINQYSVKNQLRFSENLVKTIRKDEPKYYDELIHYSKSHLMLYPYHLSDKVVRGLRITPFQYYINIIHSLLSSEKSYDSIPNFTAADCLRLLGIGRNQYIEIMNQHRSGRKLFRKNSKPARDLLPSKPLDVSIEPWFYVQIGNVTVQDVNICVQEEKNLIDFLIDNGQQSRAGSIEIKLIQSLYRKGLIYFDVPIENDSFIVVPPLEGFVMNRINNDYFETLLYKIFVSIDENTTVQELAEVLDIEVQQIKSAVSLYCRLGFAYKKNYVEIENLHPSWKNYLSNKNLNRSATSSDLISSEDLMDDDFINSPLVDLNSSEEKDSPRNYSKIESSSTSTILTTSHSMGNLNFNKRIAFLYDSTLTAYLMMGNLSLGLKNHAVTMFEVGKMADESLECFLSELENIKSFNEDDPSSDMMIEGEAQRYFFHAKTLKNTILYLRNNPNTNKARGIDLIRCESLLNLDPQTCSRLMNKNYDLLISMAPLTYEVKNICYGESIPHFGPYIQLFNSIWFKLFVYSVSNSGPVSLLLPRGTILTYLPEELEDCDKYLVTSWGHDSVILPGSNILFALNDALAHSSIFVQAYGSKGESTTVLVPYPFDSSKNNSSNSPELNVNTYEKWSKHPAIIRLGNVINLKNNIGYITLCNIKGSNSYNNSNSLFSVSNTEANLSFLSKLKEEDEMGDEESESDENIVFIAKNNSNKSLDEENIPKNGFTDDQCAKLYEDELKQEFLFDDVEDNKEVSQPDFEIKPKLPSISFDSRQQKIESLRLDLSINSSENKQISNTDKEVSNSNTKGEGDWALNESEKIENEWYDDWTILDCQFGMPLFDVEINQIICERMVRLGLWNDKSLEKLIKSNDELAKQIKTFLNQLHVPKINVNLNPNDVPLPVNSIFCVNGKITEFKQE